MSYIDAMEMSNNVIMILSLFLLSGCYQSAPANRGKTCYAIERNEIYIQGFLHQDSDGELLLDFRYSADSLFTTGHLVGCSEFVSEALIKFHHTNKRRQYLGRVKVGVWGIVLKPSEKNRYADVIAEQIVAL